MPIARRGADPLPVSPNQRQLLRPVPSLDLPLAIQRFDPGLEAFGPDHTNRQAHGGVAPEQPGIMLRDPLFKIIGMPAISSYIVDLPHNPRVPMLSP